MNVAISALAETVLMTWAPTALPLLLMGSGSAVEAVLDAVFVIEPPAGAVMVMVKFVPVLAAKFVKLLHVTTPLLKLPPPDALTNTELVGRMSLTTTLLAVEGPRFVTLIV